jgi:DNA-binding YbaB/EbfC family protein
MFSKLKNIKDLRSQAKGIQSQLEGETAEGSAAFGKVKVVVNGNQQVISVKIDPEMFENKEKLQDAIKEAVNEAMKKIQRTIAMKMQQGGLSLPGM